MNNRVARRVLVILVAIVVVVAVAGLAYYAGSNMPGDRGFFPRGPMHMYGGYDWPGMGLFGLLAMLAIGFLVVWLIVALVSGPGAGRAPDTSGPGGIAGLRELTELHDKGALTDEEFTAAKRRLLGL